MIAAPIGILSQNGEGFLGIGHSSPDKFPQSIINRPPIINKTKPINAAHASMKESQRGEIIGRLRSSISFGLVISKLTRR